MPFRYPTAGQLLKAAQARVGKAVDEHRRAGRLPAKSAKPKPKSKAKAAVKKAAKRRVAKKRSTKTARARQKA